MFPREVRLTSPCSPARRGLAIAAIVLAAFAGTAVPAGVQAQTRFSLDWYKSGANLEDLRTPDGRYPYAQRAADDLAKDTSADDAAPPPPPRPGGGTTIAAQPRVGAAPGDLRRAGD